jgi:uncharacterized membrane protein
MEANQPSKTRGSSLRRAIWRGSSIIAPPLVTLLLLIWIASAIEQYVLNPLETTARTTIVWLAADIHDAPPPGATLLIDDAPERGFDYEGVTYIQPPIGRRFLPDYIMGRVDANLDRLPRDMQNPLSATNYYEAYVKIRYMPRWFTIPLLLLVLLSVLYFVGQFLAAGVGRLAVNGFERVVAQLPVVRNLYGSVKQVTDFVTDLRIIGSFEFLQVASPHVGSSDMSGSFKVRCSRNDTAPLAGLSGRKQSFIPRPRMEG